MVYIVTSEKRRERKGFWDEAKLLGSRAESVCASRKLKEGPRTCSCGHCWGLTAQPHSGISLSASRGLAAAGRFLRGPCTWFSDRLPPMLPLPSPSVCRLDDRALELMETVWWELSGRCFTGDRRSYGSEGGARGSGAEWSLSAKCCLSQLYLDLGL